MDFATPKGWLSVRFWSGVPSKRCNRKGLRRFYFLQLSDAIEYILCFLHPIFVFEFANQRGAFAT